jgi:hypothetical protein
MASLAVVIGVGGREVVAGEGVDDGRIDGGPVKFAEEWDGHGRSMIASPCSRRRSRECG